MKKRLKKQSPKTDIRHVEGSVRRNERGFGWLDDKEAPELDIFIPPRELRGIFAEDIVSAEVHSGPKGLCAENIRLVRPRQGNIIGVLRQIGNRTVVMPREEITDKWIDVSLTPKNQDAPDIGDVVEVSLSDRLDDFHRVKGKIVGILGQSGSLGPEIAQIIAESEARTDFDDSVMRAAEKFGTVPKAADIEKRIDLQKLPFVTIDGVTAKDFDDAVLGIMREGKLVVFVAIADVAHYVKEGKPLDVEALERGNSIYFPGKCIPMLPEALSNGLCSLNPKVPRLTMVAEYEIHSNGSPKLIGVYEATIKSKARLTYEEVESFLNGNTVNKNKFPSTVQKSLKLLIKASAALRGNRVARGAIDFEMPETVISLNEQGEPANISPVDRLESTRLIEDLMVAANEVTAQFLSKKSMPAIYRVHDIPDPEKIKNFLSVVQKMADIPAHLMGKFEKSPSPLTLSGILKALKEHPSKPIFDMLLLRSMMQAMYTTENVGHFGLGSEAYSHFTSPIRRYPDLALHRLLKQALKLGKKKLAPQKRTDIQKRLEEISAHCSVKEREAMVLERKINALHSVWYMREKVGVEDTAAIVGVTEFGVFAKLSTYHVEGLVHISLLSEKRLEFDPVMMRLTEAGSNRIIAIGDTIRVKVAKVDIAKRFIDLALADKETSEKKTEDVKRGREKQKRRRKKS